MSIGILGTLSRPQRQPQKALSQARKLVQTVVGTGPSRWRACRPPSVHGRQACERTRPQRKSHRVLHLTGELSSLPWTPQSSCIPPPSNPSSGASLSSGANSPAKALSGNFSSDPCVKSTQTRCCVTGVGAVISGLGGSFLPPAELQQAGVQS